MAVAKVLFVAEQRGPAEGLVEDVPAHWGHPFIACSPGIAEATHSMSRVSPSPPHKPAHREENETTIHPSFGRLYAPNWRASSNQVFGGIFQMSDPRSARPRPCLTVARKMDVARHVGNRCGDDVRTGPLIVGEGVGDDEPDRGMAVGQSNDILRGMMVVGVDPIGHAHLDHGQTDTTDFRLERGAWSAVPAVQPFSPGVMHETVAVWIDRIVMVDFKAGIRPSPFEPPFCGLHDLNRLQHGLEAARVGKVAQVPNAVEGARGADDAERKSTLTVRDVLPFEKQEGQTEHVITMKVSDQDCAEISRRTARTAQSDKGRG